MFQGKGVERGERPSLAFARLDLDDEQAVSHFMYWLFAGRYPRETFPIKFDHDIAPEDVLYTFFDSPNRRMGLLMVEEMLGRPLKDEPWLEITISPQYFSSLAKENDDKLKGIQARLREVLEDHKSRSTDKEELKQELGVWEAERWLLNEEMREFVNCNLKRVTPKIVAIPSHSISVFEELAGEQVGDYEWEEVFLIPKDFEAAIYADLAEFFRSDGDIATCTLCGFFIEPSGQQRARFKKGQPIYHPKCHKEKKKQYLRDYRQGMINSDPEFRDKERQRIKEYYQRTVKGIRKKSLRS